MAVKKRKVSKKTYQDAKAYYTHGGAAYDIEPIEEEYAPPKKQIKKQKKIKKNSSTTMQIKANRIYSIKIALVLGIFFCGTLAFMWSSALATSQRVETQKYKNKFVKILHLTRNLSQFNRLQPVAYENRSQISRPNLLRQLGIHRKLCRLSPPQPTPRIPIFPKYPLCRRILGLPVFALVCRMR